jgi:arylsulfatase A-like enzyme
VRNQFVGRAAKIVAISLLFGCGGGEENDPIQMVRVQRDLLQDFDNWEIVSGPADGAPSVSTMALSLDPVPDSGDLPSLILPPPGTVRYTVPEGDPPAILRVAAGVDLSVPRNLEVGTAPMRLRFAVELDDRVILDEIVDVVPKARDKKPSGNPPTWRWAGGGAGVKVRGGQTLTLRTALIGLPRLEPEEMLIGYGGLTTETVESRSRTESSPDRPNVVLLVMDTARTDRCSAFGYEKATTPHLERLTERGIAYDNAWATSPWTWPSTASILTGLEPPRHGVLWSKACFLAHELPTLAKVLQERGFTTGGFSCNPLIVPNKNFDGGFERFDFDDRFVMGTVRMPAVLDWVRENAERRFFLYVHLVDPHHPHRPLESELSRLGGSRPDDYGRNRFSELSSGLRTAFAQTREGDFDHRKYVSEPHEQWLNDVYDACIATGDHHLGTILDLLEELGLDDRTVIGYTSDHGEELFDHSLIDHAHTLHPELMHVPLVLAGPGIPRGVRSGIRVSNRHLGPTLARFGAAELPVEDSLDLARPEELTARPLRFHTSKGIWNDRAMMPIFGYLDDDWAFHWAPRGVPYASPPDLDPGLGQWRLYDRRTDPFEHIDIAADHPELCETLRSDLEKWNEELTSRSPGSAYGAGAATLRMLQDIGYAGKEEESDD